MRLLPCGDAAVLAELDDLDAVLDLYGALLGTAVSGVVDVVPAARTLLVRFDPSKTDAGAVARTLRSTRPRGGSSRPKHAPVEIPVRYDGDDLPDVARLTGLPEAEVVDLHTSIEWTVAFVGFAPGFGYLVGGDERLHVPRRDDPRTRVPTGSVGLAGPFSGVYPRDSPGGWQLIGRTDAVLWDLDRDPPALLVPGARVRFRDVG
jgi:KipI family sensor histidine kinase inhibitor